MLCQFSFQNFKSYKDETTFDFRAMAIPEFQDALIRREKAEDLLPVSAVYGPNGGGKTNLLQAFFCLINLVVKPIHALEKNRQPMIFQQGSSVAPFMLDESSANEPTIFQVFFRVGEKEYQYYISLKEEIVFESFSYKPLRFIRKEKMNQELQEAILAFLDKKEKESRILEITTREGKCCIAVDDIIFLESRQHYLKICCENENFELRGRISDYETMLEKYGFVRVNIGFIINCKYIKILKTKKIILCNGMEINIGSNRHDKVRHAYMEYVREKNKWKL